MVSNCLASWRSELIAKFITPLISQMTPIHYQRIIFFVLNMADTLLCVELKSAPEIFISKVKAAMSVHCSKECIGKQS